MYIVKTFADCLVPAAFQRKVQLFYEHWHSKLSLDNKIVIITGVVIRLYYLLVNICLSTRYWIMAVGIGDRKF